MRHAACITDTEHRLPRPYSRTALLTHDGAGALSEAILLAMSSRRHRCRYILDLLAVHQDLAVALSILLFKAHHIL